MVRRRGLFGAPMWARERLLLDSSLGHVDRSTYAKEEASLWQKLVKVPRSLEMSDAGGTNFISMDLDKVSSRLYNSCFLG